jgi:hypothetical protein
MFEDQDDLVERAVSWLCEASLDAGEDAGEWVETLGMVGDRLSGLHEAAVNLDSGQFQRAQARADRGSA